MANFFHYQKILSPDEEQAHKVKNYESVARTIASVVIIVLIIILIGEILFHFFVAPRIALRTIRLETDMDIALDQVKKLGNIEEGTFFYLINEKDIQQKLIEYPYIEKADVKRIFPNILHITLIGRKPLGILMIEYNNVRLPALIDENGMVYRIGNDITQWDLPIIQGVEFDDFRLGSVVHDSYFIMLEDIRNLMSKDKHLLHAFSEFYIDEVYEGIYEWIIIPEHVPVRLRVSAGVNREMILYMVKILDIIQKNGINDITEIDFRAGNVIYR